MSTMIISNCTEEIVGDLTALTADQRRSYGWGAQRMLWYARDGDTVVLPAQPDPQFLAYVTGLTGTDVSTLALLIPPAGELGGQVLSPDRLADEDFRREVRDAVADRGIDDIVSIYTDSAVADFARATGLGDALPGRRFSAENGDAIVNSKAVFRAVAAGVGVPTARGVVTGHREQARETITELLDGGHHVMVKKEYAAGGFGNEILSRVPGVRVAGAQKEVALADDAAVRSYLDERWSWLTGGRDDRLVIERYLPDTVTVYAEFDATDTGCVLRGTGEIMMDPTAVGEIVPPQSISAATHEELVERAHLACESFRLLGYRGNICADAIVAPDGEIVFTETNGRLTASTHLHHNIVQHVVGDPYRKDRVFIERAGRLSARSFPEAVERLTATGHAYDPAKGTGVVLTANYVPINTKITYCVVAEDLESARATEAAFLDAMAEVAAG